MQIIRSRDFTMNYFPDLHFNDSCPSIRVHTLPIHSYAAHSCARVTAFSAPDSKFESVDEKEERFRGKLFNIEIMFGLGGVSKVYWEQRKQSLQLVNLICDQEMKGRQWHVGSEGSGGWTEGNIKHGSRWGFFPPFFPFSKSTSVCAISIYIVKLFRYI